MWCKGIIFKVKTSILHQFTELKASGRYFIPDRIYCSDCTIITTLFVSEVKPVFMLPFLNAFSVSTRQYYTPPCFEGVGPLSEDGVLDPHQHRDGSIYTATGLCTAFTVASLGDLGGFSPCIGRALGEIRARKLLIHGTGKCMRALRWQYPYFGLRLRVIDMGLATKYLIMVI